jgi:type IV pilus assembly protein PilM
MRLPFIARTVTITVGIDMGHDSIKAVELEFGSNGLCVSGLGKVPTPPHSISEGQVVAIDQVSTAIRDLWRLAGIRTNQVVASVSGQSVFVRTVQMPRMNESTLKKTIPWEAKKYFNFNPEDTVLECSVVGTSETNGNREMDVMLIAAPKALVDSRVAALEASGLEPMVVDVGSLAYLRALLYKGRDKGTTVAVVDLGGSYTEVVIACDGKHTFQRTIPLGGNSAVNSMVTNLGYSHEQAVALLQSMSAADIMAASPGMRDGASVTRGLLDELLREIRRTLNFYQSQYPEGSREGTVDKVLLCGGFSKLAGIAGMFSEVLGIPTELAYPPESMIGRINPEIAEVWNDDFPFYVQAFGLAAWEYEASGRRKSEG